MKCFCASLLVLVVSSAIAQQSAPATFKDALLDRLIGEWKIAGVVHGQPSNQTLRADWVLHHQFLRMYEKSSENVASKDFPFEAVFFIGYDDDKKQHVVHLMDVFGGRDSETLGYGKRGEDNISFTFKNTDSSVTEKFTYEAKSNSWHIVSSVTTPEGKQIPILDLTATPSPVNTSSK
jgi:hypothetical protein